jgi:hypothetical protein
VIATSFMIAITQKNINEKRVADYNFAIATNVTRKTDCI